MTMADVLLQTARTTAEQILHDRGLQHLSVRLYGTKLVIYSGAPADAENRARLTHLRPGHYRLDMAGHRGRWEPTPYYGTWRELLTQLIDQFGFVLVPWS
jgi:hypothetical protein